MMHALVLYELYEVNKHDTPLKLCFRLLSRWVHTEPQAVNSHIVDFVSGWSSGKRLLRHCEQETNLRIWNRDNGNVKLLNAIRCGW
jgi:hypothetical protein